MRQLLAKITLAAIGLASALGGVYAVYQWRAASLPPDEIALAYVRAVYARDYAQAWELISAPDKQYKTREQYLVENESFTGLEQELAYLLAGWIRFSDTQLEIEAGRATVSTHVEAPNGNQPEVKEILRAAEDERKLPAAERQVLLDRLHALHAAGQIEIVEGDQTFILTHGPNFRGPWFDRRPWRVWMDWAGAVVVKLTAEVSPDLPWDFYPLQYEVRALPGETLMATYRATNRSNRTITGKARHFVLPDEYETYFNSIQCFCFLQETLGPGESADLTLIFRIDYDVPGDVRQLENKYVFYPVESFR